MFASTDMSSDGVGVSVFRVMDGGAYFYRKTSPALTLALKTLKLNLISMLKENMTEKISI